MSEFEPGLPPPQEDRLWRHPSELAAVKRSQAITTPDSSTTPDNATTPEPHPGHPAAVNTGGRTIRAWTLLPAVLASLMVGAGLAVLATSGDSRTSVAQVEVRERTAVQQVAFVTNDTLSPALPAAAGHTSRSVARVVAQTGAKSRIGSGVVLRSGTTVLTAHDLVAAAEVLTVVFHADDRRDAELVGLDPASGLAVLRVLGEPLQAAVLGTSTTQRAGSPVNLLIGTGMSPLMAPTQLDAARQHLVIDEIVRPSMLVVTPPRAQGVIGAAALDARGTVIGIVTSVSPDQAFITSIEIARRIEQDLSDHGEVHRGSLGVTVSDATVTDATDTGSLIQAVAPDGPAFGSLEIGDVITSVAGRAILSTADLAHVLTELQPGDLVSVTVDRNGSAQTHYGDLGVDVTPNGLAG